MWFRQLQLFHLGNDFHLDPEAIQQNLENLPFTACLPSLPSSMGWTTFAEEEEGAPYSMTVNNCVLFCLKIEEKILPATVVRQEQYAKIKEIEAAQNRKIRQKEKLALKDEIIQTLLVRAFTKITRLYAYIDLDKKLLVLDSTNAKKIEQFLSIFKKTFTEAVSAVAFKKLAPLVTHWLKHQDQPTIFAIEKNVVLQDPSQQKRIIRCQQQDLFAPSIQSLLKEGCEVKQIALSWQDRIQFTLTTDEFTLRNIQFPDEIREQANEMEPETRQQQYQADFFIMSATFSELLQDLLAIFASEEKNTTVASPVMEPA